VIKSNYPINTHYLLSNKKYKEEPVKNIYLFRKDHNNKNALPIANDRLLEYKSIFEL
jgi:hypothetical protein